MPRLGLSLILAGALAAPAVLADEAALSAGAPETKADVGSTAASEASRSAADGMDRMRSGADSMMSTTGSTAGVSDSMQSGSTGNAATAPMGVLAHVEQPAGAPKGRTAKNEVMRTALLNRFSQLGFADVREFRRDGESYVTEAKTADGKWVDVTLDPASGNITAKPKS